jgi:hypothetical protein
VNIHSLSPLKVLNTARKAVPAVDYALGVAGVAIAAGIVSAAVGVEKTGVVILAGTFIAMILLFLFARLAAANSPSIHLAGTVMLWIVLLFFGAFLMFTISAFVIQQPRSWAVFIGVPMGDSVTSVPKFESDSDDGQLKLAKWFCLELSPNFNFRTALKRFPLSRMPEPKFSRNKSTETGTQYNTYSSDTDSHRITYTYAVPEDDPDDAYGYTLLVEEMGKVTLPIMDTPDKRQRWLSMFGSLSYGSFGPFVGIGSVDPALHEPAFKFAAWSMRNGIQAEWWSSANLDLAKQLCKRIQVQNP